MNEIEVKFLNIHPEDVEKVLLAKGAKKMYDFMFEEWIFQRPEWQKYKGRARIRAEKDKITIAYKETTRKTSEGNVEIEFEVSDKEQAIEFINKLDIPLIRHQQKRRIHYVLNGVSIDIDFWPQIPPLVEIEGKNLNEIKKIAATLGFFMKDVCELDAFQVIQDIYHLDLSTVKEYTFD